MKKIDITNIVLNENAYFFTSKGKITKKFILKIFQEARDEKDARRSYDPLIKQSLFEGGREVAKYSLDIFDFDQKPSFLKEPQELWETKTALFLILEYNEYVVIFRKNISGIKSLKSIAEPIDYSILANFYIDDKSKFEKIVSNTLNTADNAIQTKTAEAIDLKGVMTRFGASKQVISAMRLDNEGDKATISLNTSRVNALKLRQDLEPVLFWSIKMCNLITAAIANSKMHRFLACFAVPIDFEREIQTLNPKFLLFRFNSIIDEIDSGLIQSLYQEDEEGKRSEVKITEIIQSLGGLITLNKDRNDLYTGNGINVRVNQKSLTVNGDFFKNLFVKIQDGSMNLAKYLNYQSHYLITFEEPEYAYTHHKIFKDHRLLNDLEIFLDTFIPEPLLINVTSEKGKSYTENSSEFENDSLFGIVDKMLTAKQNVICDDLGVEWGDFIAIHHNEISFYHCKYNDNALSASYLQEVFGQAQKNLGYLELSDEDVEYRESRWSDTYTLNKVTTKIKRIRRCEKPYIPIQSIKESIRKASESGNLKRSVYVVINFLSKTELSLSLHRLKNGEKFENKGVTLQILWFVNAVLSSANEIGVEFRVICKP
ncbi:hypothetical protein ABTW24_24530 [Sphingobacterium thalpophilum]|uniref:Sporadically distributed protein, TIGR04141 family n=1 Tax=Sphingobacterium thalpophilum TaxID=259 RepID=A0ABV4HJW0_9SPHI|nr:hypothetical protein [Sphingobacterium sp. InxBP1]MCW8309921.1 hypothetical protein [Sphingobacterium sp. InxBP1]